MGSREAEKEVIGGGDFGASSSAFDLVSKMKVILVSRSGREIIKGGLELKDSATVSDLQEAIHRRTPSVADASSNGFDT
ncbi:hypothetical protein ACLOJK_029949 [Asimina triloba]